MATIGGSPGEASRIGLPRPTSHDEASDGADVSKAKVNGSSSTWSDPAIVTPAAIVTL